MAAIATMQIVDVVVGAPSMILPASAERDANSMAAD